jgi:hypothetical protein
MPSNILRGNVTIHPDSIDSIVTFSFLRQTQVKLIPQQVNNEQLLVQMLPKRYVKLTSTMVLDTVHSILTYSMVSLFVRQALLFVPASDLGESKWDNEIKPSDVSGTPVRCGGEMC